MATDWSPWKPTRPVQLDPADFPSYEVYQKVLRRERNRARVRNIRVTNRHLSLADIVNYTGIPSHEVRAALSPDLTIGPMNPY